MGKEKKPSTLVKKGAFFSHEGSLPDLADRMEKEHEGIYIAYDENLFEVLYSLGEKMKKEPALVLWEALQFGLLQFIDETSNKT